MRDKIIIIKYSIGRKFMVDNNWYNLCRAYFLKILHFSYILFKTPLTDTDIYILYMR